MKNMAPRSRTTEEKQPNSPFPATNEPNIGGSCLRNTAQRHPANVAFHHLNHPEKQAKFRTGPGRRLKGLLPPRTVMAEPGAEQPAETVVTQQHLKLNSQRRPTKPSVATTTGGDALPFLV